VSVDRSRVTTGEAIAAISGVALIVFLFISWFDSLSAWETFDVVDVILAAIALLAVLAALATMAQMALDLPVPTARIVQIAGWTAVVITVVFLLEGTERKIGIWLALAASIGILYGASRALTEAGAPARRTRRTAPPPGRDPGAP